MHVDISANIPVEKLGQSLAFSASDTELLALVLVVNDHVNSLSFTERLYSLVGDTLRDELTALAGEEAAAGDVMEDD